MKNINNMVIENCNALREKINSLSPGTLRSEMPVLLTRRDCTEMQLQLTRQFMADDLADFLANNRLAKILYARRTAEKKYYEVVAYSEPCDGEMYVIRIHSKMYGVVDNISIAFYDSLEKMFLDIRTLYQSSESDRWVILEKQKPYVFFASFT